MSASLAITAPRRFVASVMQQRFFGWVETGTGSAILKAVAGSGKSTSIVRALPFIPETATVLIMAFNAPIAKEMKAKIAALGEELGRSFRNVEACTFHSRGFRALTKRWGRETKCEVDDGKVRKILKDRLSEAEYEIYGDFVNKLVGYAKGVGVGIPGLGLDDFATWAKIVETQELWLDDESASEERGIEIARKALAASNFKAERDHWIDFNDQLYLPLLWNIRQFGHDWVILDEAQDTNPVRREFAKRLLRADGRLIAVGDPKQCQPAGTLVHVSGKGGIPIEELRVGDEVASYCNGYFPGTSQQGRKVEAIASRSYDGRLIKISAGDFSHEVTPNHRCFVRMTKRKGSCVYVMRNKTHARVGRCNTSYGVSAFGLGMRAKQEGASEAWILGFFEDDDAARLMEMTVAYKYRLPQMCFKYNEFGGERGAAVRSKFWKNFPKNIDGLRECLRDFDLDEAFPFYARDGKHIGSSYSFECQAVNLFSGWMDVCLFRGDRHKPDWQTAAITSRRFKGKVYSLKVQPTDGGRRLYIANGIVTHNSIYGFTGASHDAMDQIANEFRTTELPLTVSYRCPRAVGEVARQIVPYFEVADNAPVGEVATLPLKDVLAKLGNKDMILCRQTAPLISLAFSIIAGGRGCRVLGKDVGAGLVKLIKQLKPKGVPNLVLRLEAFRERQVAKFNKAEQFAKAEAEADRVECVLTVIESLGDGATVPDVIARVESLFGDGEADLLTLSTIHKAKGREAVNVAVYRPELSPSKAAKSEEAFQQELHLIYVRDTRAMNGLYFIEGEAR
jgi:hypothetical protein